MNSFGWKVDVNRFSFDNLHQDFNIMKDVVYTTMDVCVDKKREEHVYEEKFMTLHSVFLF